METSIAFLRKKLQKHQESTKFPPPREKATFRVSESSLSNTIALTANQEALCGALMFSKEFKFEKALRSKLLPFKDRTIEFVRTLYRAFFHCFDAAALEDLTANTLLRFHEEVGFRRGDLEFILCISPQNAKTMYRKFTENGSRT